MFLNFKYLLFVCILYATSILCSVKVSYYMVTERPKVTFLNHSYIAYVNISSRRHGRGSPMYYVDSHYKTLMVLDDTIKVDYYFYEFLSNEYRRSFVEVHFKYCDLIHNDKFIGTTMNQGKLAQPCPHPPGEYHVYNVSIPSAGIPPGFPFTKGRIYMNITHGQDRIFSGHIDMELKEKLIKSAGRQNKKNVLHKIFED